MVPIVPGTKAPDIWNWRELCTGQKIAQTAQWAEAFGKYGIGILTGNCPAIDIDVLDAVIADEIETEVFTMFGQAPTRIGKAPKRLMVFRCDTPFKKMRAAGSGYYLPGEEHLVGTKGYKCHNVEILGDGQQFVAFAIHPDTKQPYTWVDDGLKGKRRDDLPVLNAADAAEFLERVRAIFEKHGAKPIVSTTKGDRTGPGATSTTGNNTTIKKVRAALMSIPADDYDRWVQVALILRGAFNGTDSEDEALELYHDWSETDGRYDPEETDAKWESAAKSDGRMTCASIFKWAWDLELADMVDARDVPGTSPEDDFRSRIVFSGERAKIYLEKAKLVGTNDAAGCAILDFDAPGKAPVMGFGEELVTITVARPVTVKQVDGRDLPPMPIIKGFCKYTLTERIAPAADFFKLPKKKDADWEPCDPPVAMASFLLARGPLGLGGTGEDAPALAGICEFPTLRPDGSLLTTKGYDAGTRLYAHWDGDWLPVPDQPTHKQAVEALAYLRYELFRDFPFQDDLSRDIAVAMMLTYVIRRSLDLSPAFAVCASVQSSGKTTLVDLISRVATGRPVPASTLSDSEDEQAKALLAMLKEGHGLVLFDNVADGQSMESTELAKVITSEVYANRILSTNSTARVPTSVLWTMTGNNLRLGADMATRILRCYLKPMEERPDQRSFSRPDLKIWAAENRQVVMAHALTLLRAWAVAKSSGATVTAVGSRFNMWASMVRDAIVWAGGIDVGTATASAQDEDPERAALAMLIQGMAGHGWMAVKDILTRHDGFSDADADVMIQEALGVIFEDRKVTAQYLGRFLSKHKGKVTGGLELQSRTDPVTKNLRWAAIPTA